LNIKHDRELLYHVISLALPADITNIDLKQLLYWTNTITLLCGLKRYRIRSQWLL